MRIPLEIVVSPSENDASRRMFPSIDSHLELHLGISRITRGASRLAQFLFAAVLEGEGRRGFQEKSAGQIASPAVCLRSFDMSGVTSADCAIDAPVMRPSNTNTGVLFFLTDLSFVMVDLVLCHRP